MKKLVVYGSLRPGCYNFDRIVNNFGKENVNHLGTKTLDGFAIYNITDFYPGIRKTKAGEEVVVDLLEVSNEVYEYVKAMELGAGYNEITVELDGDEYTLYEYSTQPAQFKKIITGDWLEFVKSSIHLKEIYE